MTHTPVLLVSMAALIVGLTGKIEPKWDSASGDAPQAAGGSAIVSAPYLVRDINPGTPSGILSQLSQTSMAASNGLLFFPAIEDVHGRELWKSDGTEAGTAMVKDARPGYPSSYPVQLVGTNSTLFYAAEDGSHGKEPWRSDGTETGTLMVKDIVTGTGGSDPTALTRIGNRLFFVANDGVHYYEPWVTGGSAANTHMVKEMTLPNPHPWPVVRQQNLTDVDGALFFSYYYDAYQSELWKSNGTETGTVMLKYIGETSWLTHVGGALFFAARGDNDSGKELWKSDGSPTGTVMVKNINPGYGNNADPSSLTDVNGTLFFAADDGVNGKELWKSDGTAVGTVLVKDIRPGGSGFNVACNYGLDTPCQAVVDGVFYFTADDGAHGAELWRSDGTFTGTVMMKDISPGSGSDEKPIHLTALNGRLFFVANDGSHGYELWTSDGTPTGTVMLKDILMGGDGSGPALLTAAGNRLFFVADDGTHGKELWAVYAGDLPRHAHLPVLTRQ